MSKVRKLSGFPEWMPWEKLFETRAIEKLQRLFASYGFTPLETPAVELIETLLAKGGDDKEIYGVRRIKAEEGEQAELGLHFDLTVPTARYVALHMQQLAFPFKRSQIQKVWRHDRPQWGRYREFYQADVDIITREELPICCDAEVVTICERSFRELGVFPYRVHLNHRKLLSGAYRSLGLDDAAQLKAITIVDKLKKIGVSGVAEELRTQVGASNDAVERILELTSIQLSPSGLERSLAALRISDPLFEEGARELCELFSLVPESSRLNITVDLSLARGLAYYTGAVWEVLLPDFPDYGSVGGGGRYENLAGQFTDQKLPGVGTSLGLTRLLGLAFEEGKVQERRQSLAKVLVSVYNEEQRPACLEVAERLRAKGVATDVFFRSPKLGKQIDYASAKEIPFVLFVNESGIEVKNLLTKEQVKVDDLDAWAERVRA